MRVVCCALLPFYFVASSEIHSFWVLEELRISMWPSPFSGNRLISVSSTTNATSFETASPRERTVWGEKNRLLQEHFYKHRILHGEINPLMTKFCLRIILLSNDLTWQKKKKKCARKKSSRCPFSSCFNSFSYFYCMVRAVLSFKLGKVKTNLRTAVYYITSLSVHGLCQYTFYMVLDVFSLLHWKLLSSQYPNWHNREVFLLPESC